MRKLLVTKGHKDDMWFVVEEISYIRTPTQSFKGRSLILSIHYREEEAYAALNKRKLIDIL